MRIISGKFRGRKLADCLNLKLLRPTTDKSRESLFNILQAGKFLSSAKFNVKDCNFLDACCGSGAVGIEAISRGAKKVVFVDNNKQHLAILQKNIDLLQIANQCEIINCDITNLREIYDDFDLIFLDPPYSANYEKIIKNLISQNFMKDKTILVIEFDVKDLEKYKNFLSENFQTLEERKYGKSFFGFYKIL